jgi:hypothetical protein
MFHFCNHRFDYQKEMELAASKPILGQRATWGGEEERKKPWATSPCITTLPIFSEILHRRIAAGRELEFAVACGFSFPGKVT